MVRLPWTGRAWSVRRYQLCLDIEIEPQSGHTGYGFAVTSIVHPCSAGIQAWILSPSFDRWSAFLVIIVSWNGRPGHQQREHQIRVRALSRKIDSRSTHPSCLP